MANYVTCEYCGANNDHGERCDCLVSDLQTKGLTLKGTCSHPEVNGGKPLPLFEADGFINTLEGWQLLAKGNREGDLTTFDEAHAAYNKAHGLKEPKPANPHRKPFTSNNKKTAQDEDTSKSGNDTIIQRDNTHSIHQSGPSLQDLGLLDIPPLCDR